MKPLTGIKVLDLSRLLPGPLCTMHLADLGAEVIKVEDTGQGDYMRYIPPLAHNYSYLYTILNRNKRAISVDFRTQEGRAILYRLVESADVWVESYRAGVMKKMGLDYDTLKEINPKLLYCSITGYGQSGKYAHLAGHDLNFCALTGILDQIGVADAPPALYNFQIGDIVGGSLTAALSILAALVGRNQTQTGRYLDVSIYTGTLSHAVIPMATVLSEGNSRPRGKDILTGALHNYNVYSTSDGRAMAVAPVEWKFWELFCKTIERPDLIPYHVAAGADAEYVKQEIATIFGLQPFEYWVKKFETVDCCVSPVLTLSEAIAETPELFVHQTHPTEGEITYMPFPVPGLGLQEGNCIEAPAPAPGQHTVEILSELGYSEIELENYLKSNIIRY